MGDMLIANAIFRHFAKTRDLLIPCKIQNLPSVQFMLHDLNPKPAFFAVINDEQVNRLFGVASKRGVETLRLGMFGNPMYWDEKVWDQSLFAQASFFAKEVIPFEQRWTGFHVERDLSRELDSPPEPYAFIHEDVQRGFILDRSKLPTGMQCVGPYAALPHLVFDYCRLIENATELHLIDSCFAILADSLTTLKAKRKVVHIYSRPNALPPTYRHDWELLR